MIRNTTVVVLLLVVVTAGGVSGRQARIVERLDRVRLERSACFGRCPAYIVTVAAGGQVTFQGQRDVRTPSASVVLERVRVQALVEALNAAGFREMRDRYETEADGCGMISTDAPTVTITADFDGQTKTIRHYLGCGSVARSPRSNSITPETPPAFRPVPPPPRLPCPYPLQLFDLETRIDEIVGTEQWTGTSPPRRSPSCGAPND